MSVGQRLRQLRENKGMTQAHTAKAVGASGQGVITNWEKGKTTPKPQFMKAYADFFGVSQEWIKHGDFDEYVKKVLYNAIKTDVPNKINDDLKKVLDKTPIDSKSLPELFVFVNNPIENRLKSLDKYIDRIISGLKIRDIGYDNDEIIINATQILNNYISGVEGFSLIDMKLDEIYTIAKNMNLEIDHTRSLGEATFLDGVNAVIEFDGIFDVSDEAKKEHQKLLKIIEDSKRNIDRQIEKVKDSLDDKKIINKLN